MLARVLRASTCDRKCDRTVSVTPPHVLRHIQRVALARLADAQLQLGQQLGIPIRGRIGQDRRSQPVRAWVLAESTVHGLLPLLTIDSHWMVVARLECERQM